MARNKLGGLCSCRADQTRLEAHRADDDFGVQNKKGSYTRHMRLIPGKYHQNVKRKRAICTGCYKSMPFIQHMRQDT